MPILGSDLGRNVYIKMNVILYSCVYECSKRTRKD